MAQRPCNRNCVALSVLQGSQPGAAGRVEGVDLAIPEVAHENCATESAPVCRGNRNAPRRVEHSSAEQTSERMIVSEVSQQISFQVEYRHEAVSRTGHIKELIGILLRVSHIELVVEVPDVEGCVAGQNAGIREASGECSGVPVLIEDIDRAGAEVRRIEHRTRSDAGADGETFIHSLGCRSVRCDGGDSAAVPALNSAVFRGENKRCRIAVREFENIRRAVTDLAGRLAEGAGGGTGRGRNGDNRGVDRALAVIERRSSGKMVRNPERAGGAERDPPTDRPDSDP